MCPDGNQDERRRWIRSLSQPHVVAYLVGVLVLAGVMFGPDTALLMAAGAIVAASALGLASVTRFSTRWMRFSLRTALIALTVLCLALGWVVDEVRDRRAAVATIEGIGGNVRFAGQTTTADLSLPRRVLWQVFGEEYMGTVVGASLVRSSVTDADLARVGQIATLERLDLDYCPIGDAGIAQLTMLRNLAFLDVEDTDITDDALESIGKLPSLASLILDQTNVTDDGLRRLRPAPKLRYLRLKMTPITDQGLAHLATLKTLTTLDLSGTRVTQQGVTKFQQALPGCEVRWVGQPAAR